MREPVQDMRQIYDQADILVLTSDFEGTPNVVLEAMASGLPVVGTRVGGVPEVVRHGETGYLVELDDNEQIADTLLTLIDSIQLRAEMGSRARNMCANHSKGCLPTEDLYRLR